MKTFIIILTFLLYSCAHQASKTTEYKTALEYSKAKEFPFGKLIIVQGPSSKSEANINIVSPRLKNYSYVVKDSLGNTYPTEKYEVVHTEPLHWKVDKIYVSGLDTSNNYTLEVVDSFRGSQTIVDKRKFKAVNTEKNEFRFAYASCMADDYRFNEVIDPMWSQLRKQKPELVILNGDVVYVDSFEFVERKKATELDIWFRFIDSFNRLPIFKWNELTPIMATWDDHDFGTNDSDRDFASKVAARKVFLAFFGGKNLASVYQLENDSVYFSYSAFNQKLFFMDNRYFRQPNKEQNSAEPFAHWGEKQHNWLMRNLKDSSTPSWIFNGNQFFSGKDLSFKESFQTNHPTHFQKLLAELKTTSNPVVFASGDVHFSEIMKIEKNILNYETFEITSSSMHSYTGEGWENSLRLEGAFTKEFNFMIIDSKSDGKSLEIDVQSWGLQNKPYFRKKLKVGN